MTQVKKPSDLMKIATEKAVATMQVVKKDKEKVVALDELRLIHSENSKIITLVLENKDVVAHGIVFGSPLGRLDEYKDQPIYDQLPAGYHFLDAVGALPMTWLVEDNSGDALKFLRTLNDRFTRHPVVISQTEVITDNTAIGNQQATEQFKQILIPYNSASDSAQRSGAFVPRYTEYTATLLQNDALAFGEFGGVIYKLLAGAKVQINFYIAGIDIPHFQL